MNAPFDPGATAADAVGATETGTGPLVLSTATPFASAGEMVRRLYMHAGARTIHHQQGGFYLWRTTRFAEISSEEMRACIYHFLDGAKQVGKDDELLPFNPNKAKVANVFEAIAAVAQLDGSIRAPAWLDNKPHPAAVEIMPCRNGLLHLPTRALLPHTPNFFSVNVVDYDYDARASRPSGWLTFLKSLWPDDQASIDTLQELFGLLLTADTTFQKMFMLVGPKRSGKGTITRVLTGVIGKENVVGPTLSSFSQNFGLAALIGKPLAIISDARLGGRTDTYTIAERILAITGEDTLSVDRKFRNAWTGQLPTRFVLLTNELPKLQDASGAIVSRFIVLRLTKSFYGKEDLALTRRLMTELPAILHWAMDGRDRLVKRGYFVQPETALQALRELEDLASPIGAFLRDRCIVEPERAVDCNKLYSAWVTWCTEQHRDHPGTVQTFGRDLRAAVPGLSQAHPRVNGERVRSYVGVALDPSKTLQKAHSDPHATERRACRWSDGGSCPDDGLLNDTVKPVW